MIVSKAMMLIKYFQCRTMITIIQITLMRRVKQGLKDDTIRDASVELAHRHPDAGLTGDGSIGAHFRPTPRTQLHLLALRVMQRLCLT